MPSTDLAELDSDSGNLALESMCLATRLYCLSAHWRGCCHVTCAVTEACTEQGRSVCPLASVGLDPSDPASVVFGRLSDLPGGQAAPLWSDQKAGGPWSGCGVTGQDGGRAQMHLFGIRLELSRVGQKPTALIQKAVWKHSAKCLSRADSPLEFHPGLFTQRSFARHRLHAGLGMDTRRPFPRAGRVEGGGQCAGRSYSREDNGDKQQGQQ